MSARDASVVSAWSKVQIAVAVGLGLLLFALAAGLTTWLAERPDLRRRLDLTHSGRNTLDPVLAELVSKLPELTLVEVFFKPLPQHFAAAGHDVQSRMTELLTVLQNSATDKIKLIDHSPEDMAGSAEALARLQVDGDEYGLVVVHRLAVREIPRSGKPEELLEHFGVGARQIVDAVTAMQRAAVG